MLREKKDNLGTKTSPGNVQSGAGGWTFEDVVKMWTNGGFKDIAEAHNKALAAQREVSANMKSALQWANEQLAAEKEVGHNTAVALGQQIIKLEDQLAALQPTGRMGDTRCPRCGTKFEVDFYCEQGHMKPVSGRGGRYFASQRGSPEKD